MDDMIERLRSMDDRLCQEAADEIAILRKKLRSVRQIVLDVEGHASDCAVHNAPALPPGPCDCRDEGS